MPTDAIYVDGEAVLPQARLGQTVDWAYVDGELGKLPVDQPTAVELDGSLERTPF